MIIRESPTEWIINGVLVERDPVHVCCFDDEWGWAEWSDLRRQGIDTTGLVRTRRVLLSHGRVLVPGKDDNDMRVIAIGPDALYRDQWEYRAKDTPRDSLKGLEIV